jgi:hypothetical protein
MIGFILGSTSLLSLKFVAGRGDSQFFGREPTPVPVLLFALNMLLLAVF